MTWQEKFPVGSVWKTRMVHWGEATVIAHTDGSKPLRVEVARLADGVRSTWSLCEDGRYNTGFEDTIDLQERIDMPLEDDPEICWARA